MAQSEEKRTYAAICRMFGLLYVPVSIACTISFFFTGEMVSAVLSLLGIPLVMIPEILENLFNIKKSYRMNVIYFFVLLICYCGNIVFNLHSILFGFDAFSHCILGIFLVIVGMTAARWHYPSLRTKERMRTVYIISVSFSISTGIMFELIEIFFIHIFGKFQLSSLHIAADLIAILLSGFLFALLLNKFYDKQPFAFFHKASESFLLRNSKLTAPSSIKITSIQQ